MSNALNASRKQGVKMCIRDRNIAGKDIVNPCSIILSAVMMLEYFGWKESASLIEHALEQSFLDARATADLARFMPGGVSLSTSAFTREIVERIEK